MTDDQPPRILVSDRQGEPLDHHGLVDLARTTLEAEGEARSELSVSFVTVEEMADLHRTYLAEEGPTDVLSFPLDETGEDGVRVLGDVVIAPAVAAANRPDDPSSELRLLLVHGILHLLGDDHEDEADRAEMWAKQERYAGVRVS
ncbi:MAG: rRNA maturation RNase YbeY [Actinobacteria bacterium]|nr:MAG: rRNA maturation RNase YbeY [Actinomycetota bacterium]